MPVRTTPPATTATANDSSLDQAETTPGSFFTVAFDDLLRKVLFRVAISITGNIVSGATIGVLAGYAALANVGSTVGGLIGATAGFM